MNTIDKIIDFAKENPTALVIIVWLVCRTIRKTLVGIVRAIFKREPEASKTEVIKQVLVKLDEKNKKQEELTNDV